MEQKSGSAPKKVYDTMERPEPGSPPVFLDESSPATSQERESLLRSSMNKPGQRLRSSSYGSKGETDLAPPVRRGSPGPSSNPRPSMLKSHGRRANIAAPLSKRAEGIKVERDQGQEGSTTGNGSTLVIAFIVMIFIGTGNRVFMKLQTYPMHNYPFFLTMLSTFIYVPVCFAYILPMLAVGSRISPEQQAVPKFKFAIMGLLDSVAGIMGVFAVNYISNAAMIVLLQQAAIPISMCISKIFLGAKYTVSQYMGASVVIAGIIVTLIPTLFGHPTGEIGVDPVTQMIWSGVQVLPRDVVCVIVVGIFSSLAVLSCIPMCLSSVYKEKALGDDDIDVIYLNGWVAVFQFLAGLVSAVPSAYAMSLPVSELPRNTYEGYLCFLGQNSQVDESMLDMVAIEGVVTTDQCRMAPVYVSLYLCFNLVYNVVLIVILKYGSANVLFLASTVMVPIGNVAFSLKFVPHHQDLKLSDTMGLVFILTGLVVYRFSGPILELMRGTKRKITLDQETEKKAHNEMSNVVGINQAEYLEPIIQRHAWKLQKARLMRSPEQIRSSFMHRLGLPPSPSLAATSSRTNSPYLGRAASRASPEVYQTSPGIYRVSAKAYRSPQAINARASPLGYRRIEANQDIEPGSLPRAAGHSSFLADHEEPV